MPARPRAASAVFLALIMAASLTGCASRSASPLAPQLPDDVVVNPEFLRFGGSTFASVRHSDRATSGHGGGNPGPGGGNPGPGGGSGCDQSVTRSIDGAVGGLICMGHFSLMIPAGAFNGVADVTLSAVDSLELQCDIDVSPSSSRNFAVPALLTMDCAGATNISDPLTIAVVRFQGNDQWRALGNSQVDVAQMKLKGTLDGASRYGAVQGKAGW